MKALKYVNSALQRTIEIMKVLSQQHLLGYTIAVTVQPLHPSSPSRPSSPHTPRRSPTRLE